MSTTTSPVTGSPAVRGRRARAWAQARRRWPDLAILLGALVWWPAGFWGLEPWLHLPLRALDGDLLLLGATAAAAAVSLVVRSPWPRLGIVLAFSGIGWLLGGGGENRYPDEREALLVLLATAAVVGIVLGARSRRGAVAAGTVLALVAGLSPATWPDGPVVAVALALPFVVASWRRVAPTLFSVARIAITWLGTALLATSFSHGWDVLRPGLQTGSQRAEIRLVAQASWDFLRTQWWEVSKALVQSAAGWLWLALGLAVVIAVARTLGAGPTSGARRR